MRTALRRGLLVVAALVTSACATTPPASPIADLALTPYVGRLTTVDATLAGRPLRLLFDTGAGLTLVTPESATRLGCTPAGRSVGWRMNGERVEFPLCVGAEFAAGSYRHSLPAYGVFDLGKLLPPGLPVVDGILGLDAFLGACVTLEIGARRLNVQDGPCDAKSAAGWTEVPMRVATGVDGASAVAFFGVSGSNGRTLWLELDSGNLDAILLTQQSAGELRLATGLAGTTVALTFNGLVTDALPAATRDLVHDGALSAAFLEHYSVRLDLRKERAWLRPYPPAR